MAIVSNRVVGGKRLGTCLRSAEWVHRPIAPCDLIPDGLPGMVSINDRVYLLSAIMDADRRMVGWRLTREGGTVYDVNASTEICDCADATYRPERAGGCKHSAGLRRLGVLGWEPEPDDGEPAAF